MRVLSSLLLSLLLQSPPAVQGPAPAVSPMREWVVVISVPVYLPDGSVRAETIALPTTGPGLVHAFSRQTLCSPAASGPAEPADAAFGWRIASQIVGSSDTDLVVSLDWRRMWDNGRKITNGPRGTVQLTLHPGDRIPLDHIPNSSPRPDCRAVGLGLEVKLARTPPPATVSAARLPIGAMPGGAKPVDAELWLTHTAPGGAEQVLHQIVRVPEAGGRFTFAATPAFTSRGELNVELTGTIDRFRSPAGGEFLVLLMNRLVTGPSLPPAGLSATTGATVPMPVGEDLLFQLTSTAAARGGGGGRGGAVAGGGGGGSGAAGGGAAVAAGAIAGGVASMRATPGQAQARVGGGGGTGGAVATARSGVGSGNVVSAAQLALLLEGHQYSLRIRVTPAGEESATVK